jgi:PRTRC genetic system protein C
MTRTFKYQDQTWEDPGEEYTNEDVKRHLTTFFPELAQADIEEKKLAGAEGDADTVQVTFVKRAGTKGQ